MAIIRIIRIFQSAIRFATLEPQKEWPNTCGAPGQYEYHRTIVLSGNIGAIIGVAEGILISYELWQHSRDSVLEPEHFLKFVLLPLLLTAGGWLAGVCWAGALAPKTYLDGPAGQYFAAIIRAKSPLTTRRDSLVIALVATAFFIFFLVCTVMGKF